MKTIKKTKINSGIRLLSLIGFIGVATLSFTVLKTGSLQGIVTNQNSKAISKVTILLLKENQVIDSTLSGSDGSYRFVNVPIGAVNLFLEKSGFENKKISQVEITENNTAYLNITIKSIKENDSTVTETAISAGNPAKGNSETKTEETISYDLIPNNNSKTDSRKQRGNTAINQAEHYLNPSYRPADPIYYPVIPPQPDNMYYIPYYIPSPSESYAKVEENKFFSAIHNPLSTFSIDVDAASYSNARRFITQGILPPADAVRIEEFVNYFDYDYPQPTDEHPFSINMESGNCPWNLHHRLVHIGIQGRDVEQKEMPANNLVFLIDVSGSMNTPNKLPLVQEGLKMLVKQMRSKDRIAIVTYAGNAGVVLASTSGNEQDKIIYAISNLSAGGSTAGGAGIKMAYEIADENFKLKGNNRIILCTDGDFNVGVSSDDELQQLIERKRRTGIYLTVLGFGMGNYKDSKLEILADKGNGNYAYIDNILEAKKVLVNEFSGTIFTIAKDVKIQVEFNPALVQGYRLIGYENRILADKDFNDDTKDAGELGAGHTVTALYEIIPAGVKADDDLDFPNIDPLKYQRNQVDPTASGEMMTVKLRYKKPNENDSRLIIAGTGDAGKGMEINSENFKFSAAVAAFGMILKNSGFADHIDYSDVKTLAKEGKGSDEYGYRGEFLRLVEQCELIDNRIISSKKNSVKKSE